MERLTRKFTQEDYDKERIQLDEIGLTNVEISEKVGEDYLLNEDVMGTNAPMHKLGKLEDMEEELGIDLIKLLRATVVYTKWHDYGMDFYISTSDNSIYVSEDDCCDTQYLFSEYGKTWAFTREELENGKR